MTTSAKQITMRWVGIFEDRQEENQKMHHTHIQIFNPKSIVASGKPLLKMSEEQKYYGAKISPKCTAADYADEYLCTFSITNDAIVGTWLWDMIVVWMKDNKKISRAGSV